MNYWLLNCYPKVNLTLQVFPLVPGECLHRIESKFMLWKGLKDTIEITAAGKQSITFVPSTGIDPANNTVLKAIRLIETKSRRSLSFHFIVNKYIPLGSGMGGGAANAGALLKFFNELGYISEEEKYEIATEIGSDVAFFASGLDRADVSGYGEKILRDILSPERRIIRVVPGRVPLATEKVYQCFDRLVPSNFLRKAPFFNNLEPAIATLAPVAFEILEEIRRQLSKEQFAIFCGAGTTIAVIE